MQFMSHTWGDIAPIKVVAVALSFGGNHTADINAGALHSIILGMDARA